MLGRLLNIASIVCLVMCALMGLCVRSYRWVDGISGPIMEWRIVGIWSGAGRLYFWTVPNDPRPWHFASLSRLELRQTAPPDEKKEYRYFGFTDIGIILPHCNFVLILAKVAGLPWIRKSG